MLIKILKSKLHRATVTETKLDYPGSIMIDSALMKAAGILPYEVVLVADLTNGNRLETYAVAGKAGSGTVIILGAGALLIKARDIVIIFSFAYCTP
jgi:aspartate 1-decarboxylase